MTTSPHVFAADELVTAATLNGCIPRVTTATSAPASPSDGDLWLDTVTSTAPLLKQYNAGATSWYTVTANTGLTAYTFATLPISARSTLRATLRLVG